MIGKEYSFKNQKISIKTDDFQVGLTTVVWKELDFSDSQYDIQGSHGIKTSPTYMRGRKIALEGVIVADTREATSKAMDYLDALFSLQGLVSKLHLYPFQVKDEQDREWNIDAKVKEPIIYKIADDDYMDGTTRAWRVVLQAPDARYFSLQEYLVQGSESIYGGMTLGTELGAAMDELFGETIVEARSEFPTPARFEIRVNEKIESPFMIRSNSGDFFGLNIDAEVGSILVIDTKTKLATLNGENILAKRIPGSSWLNIQGMTTFSVYDKTGGHYGSDFDLSIYFKDILI